MDCISITDNFIILHKDTPSKFCFNGQGGTCNIISVKNTTLALHRLIHSRKALEGSMCSKSAWLEDKITSKRTVLGYFNHNNLLQHKFARKHGQHAQRDYSSGAVLSTADRKKRKI